MQGKVRLKCLETNRITPWKSNLILNSASTIAAKLCQGDSLYRLAVMYIEFANVASPGDTVAGPSFDATDGREYYDSLLLDETKDYLRVPISVFGLSASNETLFPGGNILTMMARTAGLVGMNGKPFSADYNSTIIGGAIAATPEPLNHDADVLFSRWYNEEEAQLLKLSTSQIAAEWAVTFDLSE